MNRPSETAFLAVRYVVVFGVLGAAGFGTYKYLVKFGQLDPFERLKAKLSNLSSNTGVDMSDVTLREYHGGKLVARAHVDKATVTQDETAFDLNHVSNGLYNSSRGPVHFAARYGTYNTVTSSLSLNQGIRVQSKDFDVQSDSATFDRQNQKVTIPSALGGKVFGGKLSAANLDLNLKNSEVVAHNVSWQGKPPLKAPLQDAPQDDSVNRVWSVKGDSMHFMGTTKEFTNGQATDGEVLMIGPKIDDDSKTDVITATGGRVAYFSGKADLMADKVIVYRKEKRAEFYGNVVMLVKAKKDQDKPPAEEPVPDVNLNTETETPKPGEFVTLTPEEKKRYDELRDQKNARDYPFHVAAEKIVYWYAKGSRHATIDGNPRARQDFPDNAWREGWAKTGTYDGEKEFLHLAGDAGKRDAHYRASNKDQFNAEWLEFSTKDNQTEEDNDLKTGPTDGVIVDSSKEDTRPPKPGQPTTPPPVKTNGGPK